MPTGGRGGCSTGTKLDKVLRSAAPVTSLHQYAQGDKDGATNADVRIVHPLRPDYTTLVIHTTIPSLKSLAFSPSFLLLYPARFNTSPFCIRSLIIVRSSHTRGPLLLRTYIYSPCTLRQQRYIPSFPLKSTSEAS